MKNPIIADIIQAIEIVAPPALQESYDNAGMQAVSYTHLTLPTT